MVSAAVRPYDALLLVSFGGPEESADVIPFLENVTRGRGIPAERIREVAAHYERFGGRSPINDQCRELIAALQRRFAEDDIDVPIYWGNRNWHPFLADAIARMKADGVRRAAVLVTSAYASYSGCRQYREDLYDGFAATASRGIRFDKLRHYFNHPGFVSAVHDATIDALDALPDAERRSARIVFVTHSIPTAMNATAGPDGDAYSVQHRAACNAVVSAVTDHTGKRFDWDLVFCSRSGSPAVPWLEPDVNDHLRKLAANGVNAVVLVPIGFISDHMEVVFDLDTEAVATAADLGLICARAATAGTHPGFVDGLRDLLLERAAIESGRPTHRAVVGTLPPCWDVCPASCCPNPRGWRPALCETSG